MEELRCKENCYRHYMQPQDITDCTVDIEKLVHTIESELTRCYLERTILSLGNVSTEQLKYLLEEDVLLHQSSHDVMMCFRIEEEKYKMILFKEANTRSLFQLNCEEIETEVSVVTFKDIVVTLQWEVNKIFYISKRCHLDHLFVNNKELPIRLDSFNIRSQIHAN